jgi:hypothetical protein
LASLEPDLDREIRRTLTDLQQAQLAATAWPVVAGDLARLAVAVERADSDLVRASLVPISQATFEGKVRGRLAGADKQAAVVVATKPTRALPAVGAASAAILVLIGYQLGGWVVAAGTAVFAVFIFGVALAGTHTTKDRLDHRRRSKGLAPTMEPTEGAPTVVADAIERIEGLLDS